jgi:hypothetical protein
VLLFELGDVAGLRRRADAGDFWASQAVAAWVRMQTTPWRRTRIRKRHYKDDPFLGRVVGGPFLARGLSKRAAAGNKAAAQRFADLLAMQAHAGIDVAEQWADHLADLGDIEGLRHRADTGDHRAAFRLAKLLTERADAGDETAVAELTERADAEDGHARSWLVDLLTERAAVGDETAAAELTKRAGIKGWDRNIRWSTTRTLRT